MGKYTLHSWGRAAGKDYAIIQRAIEFLGNDIPEKVLYISDGRGGIVPQKPLLEELLEKLEKDFKEGWAVNSSFTEITVGTKKIIFINIEHDLFALARGGILLVNEVFSSHFLRILFARFESRFEEVHLYGTPILIEEDYLLQIINLWDIDYKSTLENKVNLHPVTLKNIESAPPLEYVTQVLGRLVLK
jgi:hypothetical protein